MINLIVYLADIPEEHSAVYQMEREDGTVAAKGRVTLPGVSDPVDLQMAAFGACHFLCCHSDGGDKRLGVVSENPEVIARVDLFNQGGSLTDIKREGQRVH